MKQKGLNESNESSQTRNRDQNQIKMKIIKINEINKKKKQPK